MKLNFLFVRQYSANREISFHNHNVYEFVYYIDGKGETICGDQAYQFDKDSYIIIPPNLSHNETHHGKGHIMAIGFSIEESNIDLSCKMHNGFNPNIFTLIQKIKMEYIKKDIFYEETLKILINELAIYLKREQMKAVSDKQLKNSNIAFAVSYINEYFMTDIDLDELAHSAGYSKDHFRILFKKHTGEAPKSFILHKRLSYAKRLLKDIALPLTTVSSSCGFEYYSCFSAFFKKKTGYTPFEYRNINTPILKENIEE